MDALASIRYEDVVIFPIVIIIALSLNEMRRPRFSLRCTFISQYYTIVVTYVGIKKVTKDIYVHNL